MRKLAYQALGYWTWRGMKAGMRTRAGETVRKAALGGLLLALVAALLLAGRRAASE